MVSECPVVHFITDLSSANASRLRDTAHVTVAINCHDRLSIAGRVKLMIHEHCGEYSACGNVLLVLRLHARLLLSVR